MAKKTNNGKLSEAEFQNCLRTLYKNRVHIIRFDDAAVAYGLNKAAVKVNAQPADYLVACNGAMFLAEVKSSMNPSSFSFSNIGDLQLKTSKLVRLTGCNYIFFCHNLTTNKFHFMDAGLLHRTLGNRSSLKWEEIPEWTEYNTYLAQKEMNELP